MPIVVTGASGFIGKVLIRRIREKGYECVPVSRSSTGAYKLKGIQVKDYGEHLPSANDTLVHLAQSRAITNFGKDADKSVAAAVTLGRRIFEP